MTSPSYRRIFWVDPDRFDLKPDKNSWLEMAEMLIDRGYDVAILTHGRLEYGPAGFRARMVYLPALDRAGLFRLSLLLSISAWLFRNARKDDIVIVNPDGLTLAPILCARGLRNIHLDIRTLPVEIRSVKSHIDRMLFWTIPLRLLRGCANGFSFITKRLKDAIEEEFNKRFSHYALWQSGVNTRRFTASEKVIANSEPSEMKLFYHGTITENRGIDCVITAIASLADKYRWRVRFVVVGSGPALPKLKKLAEELGVSSRVEFRGLMPVQSIPEQISQADCCICPLPDLPEWNVSSPLKVFEYMSCGRPMILTPIVAHKDVVDGFDFVVWTKGSSADDFRQAIEYAVDNCTQLLQAARQAPEYARRHYDWSIQGAKLADYLVRTYGRPDASSPRGRGGAA